MAMDEDIRDLESTPLADLFGERGEYGALFRVCKKMLEERGRTLNAIDIRFLDIPEKRNARTGRVKCIPTVSTFLGMFHLSEDDLQQVSPELRDEFNRAAAECIEKDKAWYATTQRKVSFTSAEIKRIEEAARCEKLEFASYVSCAARMLAAYSIDYSPTGEYPDRYNTISELRDFIRHGRKMQDAFTPEEVIQAMDAAGLSPSQGMKLMAELERMRNARMNPDGSGNTLPE